MGRFNLRFVGFRWLGSALGALAIAVAAVGFWAGVTLLQRPWRALARGLLGPAPLQYQPSADDEERSRAYDEVMKRLADSTRARMAASGHRMAASGHWVTGDIWNAGPTGISLDFPRSSR